MKYGFFMALALSLVTISCKKDSDKVEADKPVVESVKKMNVQMDVIQQTPGIYAVYYTEDNTSNFNTDHVIWNEVKPSKEVQTLNFDFPEDAYPTQLRFDIGNKPEREDVIMKGFKINFAGKSVDVKGSDFFKYFWTNDSIPTSVDQANGTITFLKKKNTKHVPYFNPNENMAAELAKLQK